MSGYMENEEIHPDKSSFDIIWVKIIEPEIKKYINAYTGYVKIDNDAKEKVWEQYFVLNTLCKNHYMKTNGKLDRHKVAACYLLAISMAKPIICSDEILSDTPQYYFTFNERVALTTALSILVAYIRNIIKNDTSLCDDEKKRLTSAFSHGIKFPVPPLVNHGEYVNNFISEIHYTVEEGNINILATAHELYLLEVFTRVMG